MFCPFCKKELREIGHKGRYWDIEHGVIYECDSCKKEITISAKHYGPYGLLDDDDDEDDEEDECIEKIKRNNKLGGNGMVDTCIVCGTVIPEGRQVCPRCELLSPKELIRILARERGYQCDGPQND